MLLKKIFLILFAVGLEAGIVSGGEFSLPAVGWKLFELPGEYPGNPGKFQNIPEEISGIASKTVEFDASGELFIKRKMSGSNREALLMRRIISPSKKEIQIFFGANWYYEFYVNGKKIVDTRKSPPGSLHPKPDGNGTHQFNMLPFPVKLSLQQGENLIVIRIGSGIIRPGKFRSWACCFRTKPALEEVKQAVKQLDESSCANPDQKRREAMAVIQRASDLLYHQIYRDYYPRGLTIPRSEQEEICRREPILWYYEHAMEKVFSEVKQEVVPPGSVVLWQLYNMGYVIKTAEHCFGVDIHHRQGEKLVPLLDFLLITHRHPDHFTPRMAEAMTRAGKVVYSNFYPGSGLIKEPERTLKFHNLTIFTYQTDHSAKLQKFVMPVEIVCGEGENACVIYHSGDSFRPGQLKHRSAYIDFHISQPNPRFYKVLRPKVTLISHLQELHHSPDFCRWSYDYAFLWPVHRIQKEGGVALVPVWGEKIVWHAAEQVQGKK